jgi:Domain of unknown function (DUF4412)
MKVLRLLVGASLALLVTARADLTIVQKVEGSQGLHEIKMKVKGDHARVEINPQMTTIIDARTGEVTNLMNENKMFIRISGESAKAIADAAKSLVKQEGVQPATPTATGKKQTINGYETTEYVSDSPSFHASYWVATSYPDYQKILEQMAILQKGAFAGIMKDVPNYHGLPGLPLRTEVKISGNPAVTSTIESVNQTPLPDSDFSVPAGFSEVKVPDAVRNLQAPSRPPKQTNP